MTEVSAGMGLTVAIAMFGVCYVWITLLDFAWRDLIANLCSEYFRIFFLSPQSHHMSLMDFSWFSPSRLWPSVTDFWGWDACDAQLRYADEVYGDIWIWSTRRDLKPKFYYTTQTMVTMGALPIQEKSPWQNRESNPGPHDQ